MHVMFIHPNFPAQFGHIASHLATEKGWPCTFVTSIDTRHLTLPFTHVNYKLKAGPAPKTFYNPDSLSGMLEHLAAVYTGLRSATNIRPDLVVGHMSYGTMLYLRNLYACPFIGYFELLPPPFWSEQLVLRPEFPPPEGTRLFNATYHALTYLHLHAVDAGYTPTRYQLGTAPQELQYKLRVIFDGTDTEFFQRRSISRPVEFRGRRIGPETRVVTYVSRGLESMRGFDIFMKVAKRLYQEIPDIIFLIAGEERTNYGHELFHIGKRSFKEYVLAQDSYDLERFHFLGRIPTEELVTLYCLSDVHVYLTVPYVLSWSLMQAMASECKIVGSATAPVQEVIDHEVHGLLADFYDVDGLTANTLRILRDPQQFTHLGTSARARVLERYEKTRCIAQLVEFFESVQAGNRPDVQANLASRSDTGPVPS
jgi:glycosyltransferase involved in cell wall biosynthesis